MSSARSNSARPAAVSFWPSRSCSHRTCFRLLTNLLIRRDTVVGSARSAGAARPICPARATDRKKRRPSQFIHLHIRSEEHTSELQALMRISDDVSCLKKKNNTHTNEQ